jgi:hypothetical protein
VTDGNLELVQIVASWLTVPAAALVLVQDERRLTGDALARAWPPVSRNAALFGLWMGVPPLCMLVHFARTRRSLEGWLLGFIWVAVIVAIDLGAQLGATMAVGLLGL